MSPAQHSRDRILETAGHFFHQRGFQATHTNDLIEALGISKGTLYHHFSSKNELGFAVIEELFGGFILNKWAAVFQADDPLDAMLEILSNLKGMSDEDLAGGCPIFSLSQELSGQEEAFRLRLESVFNEWRTRLGDALVRGQNNGKVRLDINPETKAALIVAMVQGCAGMSKSARSRKLLEQLVGELSDYVEGLRP